LEESSDICRLDFFILECVCRDIRRWLDKGIEVVRVSVNLSRRHMLNRNLLSDIVRCVDAHGVPHRCLEFELTETTTDVEFNDLRRVVKGLQEFGFSTAVDDYGVGYSSLNLIKTIPWDVVKLDRSILPFTEEHYRGTPGNLLKHIVAIMKEMGLHCVAEGVETEEQLAVLKETECDMIQGFLFYRPMPAETFAERLLSL
jgi:EAL domain-containing protein (putative c-di-GMP-specific phosphodiesterase class I)